MWYNKPKEIIERRKKECALFFDGKYSNDGRVSVYPADAKGRVQWSKGKRVDVSKLLGGSTPTPTQKPAPQAKSGGNKGKAAAASGLIAAIAALTAAFWDKVEALIHSVF